MAGRYGIKPSEFWSMTHWELQRYLTGRGEAESDTLRIVAIHAAWVMNCWLDRGSKVSAGRLLGREVDIRDCKSKADFNEKIKGLR